MERILFIILGYFLGIVQSAFIIGKFYKIDMREHGSKNLGTTNTLRTLGAKAGAIVFALDVLKPVVAILISLFLSNRFFDNSLGRDLTVIYTGLGVMLGHNYPFYLKFKGGKGVACTLGTLLVFNPYLILSVFSIAVIIIYIFRYISLASITCCFIAIGLAYIFGYRGETLAILSFIATFIVFKHRTNIKRLLNGNENKFTIKKKGV